MERAVGLILIALGVWTMMATRAMHAHEHTHKGAPQLHLHSHLLGDGHHPSHPPTVVVCCQEWPGPPPAAPLVPPAMFDSR